MAALTWREVSAPNFGSTNDAFRTAATLQSNALAGLGEALTKYRAEQDANLDSHIMARALQVNDPAAYQKALADGSLLGGVDPARVSPRTMASLGSRATDLLNQAATQQTMASRAYAQDRLVSDNAIQDNAREASAKQLGIVDPSLQALSPTDQRAVQQGAVALEGGLLANTARRFSNTVNARDDDVQQVAANVVDAIRRVSATPLDALAELEQMNDLTPAQRNAAYQGLQADFGKFYAAQGGTAPAGSPGTAGGSPYDTTYNFRGTGTPISSMPISGVLAVQEESRSSQGHSPMGAFQINKQTLEDYGPKVLGKDWKTQAFTPEVQERLAKALFDDRKGGDLSKTWAALPNSSPGAYKDFTWQDMRQILAQGEVGQNLPSDPASLRAFGQASQFEVSRRQAQNNATGVTADIERNLNDTRDAPEVVQDLVKTRFPKANQADLLRLVTKSQRDNPGLSAADVASAIARSASPASWWRAGTTGIGNGVGVDDEVFAANLKSLQTGKADYMSQDNQRTRAQGDAVVNAQTSYEQAYQNLMQLRARQQAQPGISTERAEAALEAATRKYQAALSKQQSDPAFRPVRQ